MDYTPFRKDVTTMMTVKDIARRAHVSVRTLHHYDAVGLLKPTEVTEAGYRLYDDAALEKLMMIMLYRELNFPLSKIAALMDAPYFDRNRALEEQIRLLKEKRQRIDNRISLAAGILLRGVEGLDLTDMDMRKIDEYSEQAKALYGKTDAYKEYERKAAGRTKEDNASLEEATMALFSKVGTYRHLAPDSPEAQAWAAELQAFFNENYYTCTVPILRSLAMMYAGGGSMTENIDKAGGAGTGAFAKAVLDVYCDRMEQK